MNSQLGRRSRILQNLRANRAQPAELPDSATPVPDWDREQKIEQLTNQMTAVHTEVIRLADRDWSDWVVEELSKRGLSQIVVGDNARGDQLQQKAGNRLAVVRYKKSVEEWKPELFQKIEVGVTGTLGGIASTGSLILWPDASEPRLMSLAPPIHIAILEADRIYATFAEAVQQGEWSKQMPTNALLISGPSKTADIEQTLAYGIHGPQQLIVLIIE